MTATDEVGRQAARVLAFFEQHTGLRDLEHELVYRSDGPVLILYSVNPSERFYAILNGIEAQLSAESLFPLRVLLKKKSRPYILQTPESRLLLRTLSESLTINRHSFSDDFFERYIRSVFGAEERVASAGNHVVFGRRGSGKSSLLLYAMHMRGAPAVSQAWIDMQLYTERRDLGVIAEVLSEILGQARSTVDDYIFEGLRQKLSEAADEAAIRVLLPDVKRFLERVVAAYGDFVIFLDDFHVIDTSLQPLLLSLIYSFSRGSRIYLKLSAIETLTRLWDPVRRIGLEVPHDAQTVRLDYNLTMADKATEHITSILDSHATYCGLPSVRALCTEAAAMSRLVWVAAGVPRDALNIFAQAMTKASAKNQRRVAITNINVAASEMVGDKLRDVDRDLSGRATPVREMLDEIKEFCLKKEKKNAFLVELGADPAFNETIDQLIELRLLHVINEGMTRGEAGRRYMALILDYGFYIGVRAARSVDLFNKRSDVPKHADLRSLPVFVG